MKVSERMYGLPGKCIACRQKIRIPRRDEIPPGGTDIYLRDHPEFLRKVVRPASDGDDATPTGDESQDVFQGTEQERLSTAPLDPLEPLQVLCSLEHMLHRRMRDLGPERDFYQAQLARVQHARTAMDEQMRQRLMEVAIELANSHDKIAQAGLAARIGELELAAYHESAERNRRTRDRLERRQQNLRAWLTVSDPYQAGGLIDVRIDDIPDPHTQLVIPGEEEPTQPLIHAHVEGLREALFSRAHTERKMHETDTMRRDRTLPEDDQVDLRAECKAERQRAEARIAFYRERLRQSIQDYRGDLQVVQAQLELARGRVQVGEIARERFEQVETQLQQATSDYTRAIALAQRAVNANAAQDVPYPHGTFLGRLGIHVRDHGIAMDSYIAWFAAALLVGSIFFPVWGDRSLLAAFWDPRLGGTIWQWGVLAPLAAAGALVIVSAIEFRRVRGAILLTLGAVMTCATVYFLHEQLYGLGAVATIMREADTAWWAQAGVILAALAGLLTFVAATVSLMPFAERWAPALVAAATLAVVFFICTDFLGWRVPSPHVAVELPVVHGEAAQPVAVSIVNQGGRELYLTASASKLRNGYLFVIEERIGPNSWRETPLPATRDLELPPNSGVIRKVAAGGAERISVSLPPGEYRAKLRNSAHEDIEKQDFRIAAPRIPQDAAHGAFDGFSGEGAEVVVHERAEVELNLIIDGPNQEPRFAVSLYPPGGAEEQRDLSLRDEVHAGWFLTEYNQNSQTVTLSDGTQVIILERGKRLLLPIATKPAEPAQPAS